MEAERSAFAFPGSICGRTRLTKEEIQSQNVKPLKQQRTHSLNSARDSATEFQYCEQYAENEDNIWRSQYLLQRGGKIVFSLTANSTFSIRLYPASQATNENKGNDHEVHHISLSELKQWILFIQFSETNPELKKGHPGLLNAMRIVV